MNGVAERPFGGKPLSAVHVGLSGDFLRTENIVRYPRTPGSKKNRISDSNHQ